MNIYYSKQFLDKQDINEVVKSLKNQYLTQGPKINEFEKKIAKYVGSKYAVAVSSCTAGLHIALKAIGFKEKDTILTSTISFVSTSNVAYFMGGKSLFLDIDKNLGISINDLKKKIHKNIKAIIPVHMSGCAFNMEEIQKISKKYKIPIIEDCAHALGGKYQNNTMIGSCRYSDMSVFSFHPVKTITTGEGGVITTNNRSLYQKLLRLRSHGINKLNDKFINRKLAFTKKKRNFWYYEMTELGYHYRITDFQCALGVSQLKKINKFINYKYKICKKYDEAFKNLEGVELPHQNFRKFSSNHLYILRIDFKKLGITRNELFNYLRSKKIICQVHYIPIVLHPYYKKKGFKINNFPEAKKYYDECISIPCHFNLSLKSQNFIINQIKFFIYKKYRRNVLLIGSTGLLGSSMINTNKNFKFFAHVHDRKLKNSKIEKVYFKINKNNLKKIIERKKIDIILNCAGLTSIEECEKNKDYAINSNTTLVKDIVSSIADNKVKVIQISSDHLFSKLSNKITEKTKTNPQNYYALTKAKAEKLLIESDINYLILRTNFFGKGKNSRKSYSDHIINTIKSKKSINVWSNIYFSPLNIKFLKFIIINMIKQNCHGIFNLSSNEKISKYYFAKKVAKYLKLNTKLIFPKKYIQDNTICRPKNMSLDNAKIKKIFPKLIKEFSINNQIEMLK